jgi:hypothetical protein
LASFFFRTVTFVFKEQKGEKYGYIEVLRLAYLSFSTAMYRMKPSQKPPAPGIGWLFLVFQRMLKAVLYMERNFTDKKIPQFHPERAVMVALDFKL